MPALTLWLSEQGSHLEQSTHTVAAQTSGWMQPAEKAHPAKALGKHMLEEAADQFGGS